MPQMGHLPGFGWRICGCIEQVHSVSPATARGRSKYKTPVERVSVRTSVVNPRDQTVDFRGVLHADDRNVPLMVPPSGRDPVAQVNDTAPLSVADGLGFRSIAKPIGFFVVVLKNRDRRPVATLAETLHANAARHFYHVGGFDRVTFRHSVRDDGAIAKGVYRLLGVYRLAFILREEDLLSRVRIATELLKIRSENGGYLVVSVMLEPIRRTQPSNRYEDRCCHCQAESHDRFSRPSPPSNRRPSGPCVHSVIANAARWACG